MFTECYFFGGLSYSYVEVGQKSLRNVTALINTKLLGEEVLRAFSDISFVPQFLYILLQIPYNVV